MSKFEFFMYQFLEANIQESRPTRGSFCGSFCGSFAEVSAEVSASFAEVSASFAEVSAVHSQKLPRFTRGNLHEISNKFLRNLTV